MQTPGSKWMEGTTEVELVRRRIHCWQKMLASTGVTFPKANRSMLPGMCQLTGKTIGAINLDNNMQPIIPRFGATCHQIWKKFQGYHVIILNGLQRVGTFKSIGLDRDLVHIPEKLEKGHCSLPLKIILGRNTPLTTRLPKSRAYTSSSPPREQHKTLP